MGDIVQLCSVAAVGTNDLTGWLREWADALESGAYGEVCTLSLVVESSNGIACISQSSLVSFDRARLVGLLTIAANRKANNAADIGELRQ